MLTMINKYNIKTMYVIQGKSLREIARETGHTFRTVKKYAFAEDFSDKIIRKKGVSGLDPFKEIIDRWLIEDLNIPRKQRHTSKRVYTRLCDEYSEMFTLSYRSVCKYIFNRKRTINDLKDKKNEYISLTHLPAEAQLDFGEVQFELNNEPIKGYHLVLSFPYSNASFVQIFPSQNQEALFQGMKNIFEYIGKVPKEIWFDNMSTAVAKIKHGKGRVLTDKFIQFMAHYGFEAKFCNPASGNEKGNVENKVGYTRRNFLVPIPKFESLDDFNKSLLEKCEKDMKRAHYQKDVEIKELFKEDLNNMYPLNRFPFEVCKYLKCKTNKLGYIKFETNEYSVLPNLSRMDVWLKAFVNKIEILDNEYNLITAHKRYYNKNNRYTNWKDWLKLIEHKITALEYTEFYQELPKVLQEFFKSKNKVDKRKLVSALGEMLMLGDIDTVNQALVSNLEKDIRDIDSLLIRFRALIEPKKIYEEFDSTDTILPSQMSFEPKLSSYDTLIRRESYE